LGNGPHLRYWAIVVITAKHATHTRESVEILGAKTATVGQRRNRDQPRLTLASNLSLFTLGQIRTTAAFSFQNWDIHLSGLPSTNSRDPSTSKDQHLLTGCSSAANT
jgi:hypothetical protein